MTSSCEACEIQFRAHHTIVFQALYWIGTHSTTSCSEYLFQTTPPIQNIRGGSEVALAPCQMELRQPRHDYRYTSSLGDVAQSEGNIQVYQRSLVDMLPQDRLYTEIFPLPGLKVHHLGDVYHLETTVVQETL